MTNEEAEVWRKGFEILTGKPVEIITLRTCSGCKDFVEDPEVTCLKCINKFKKRELESKELIDGIKSFKELPDNLDGYGGIPVSANICDKTIEVLTESYTPPIDDVFPNPNGTITVEWENGRGEMLQLEIGKSSYSYFAHFKNREPILGEGIDILDGNDYAGLIETLNFLLYQRRDEK